MINLKKHRFWRTSKVIVLVILGVFLFPQNNFVKVEYSNAHAFNILFRLWYQIGATSNAGQYYQDLLLMHANELSQIYGNHPQHAENEFLQTILIFIPGLEALVEGKGDTVQITEEQIHSLKTELDWISSLASPSLREDIEKEQKRFPLDNFIGMTMREAEKLIILHFPLEPLIPQCTQDQNKPNQGFPFEPSLVPGSNGLRVYSILNGVYIEFPSTWGIEELGDSGLYLVPSPESPEGQNLSSLVFAIAKETEAEFAKELDLEVFLKLGSVPTKNYPILISLADFQGFEFLFKDSSSNINLVALLYNKTDQVAIAFSAYICGVLPTSLMDDPDTINEIFPNIQRIIESIRMVKP